MIIRPAFSYLSLRISVPILVLVSHGKLLGVVLLDLFVRHVLTHTLTNEYDFVQHILYMTCNKYGKILYIK